MSKLEIQDSIPPPGQPTENVPPVKKQGFFRCRSKKKGEGSCGGCLKALSCCASIFTICSLCAGF